MRDENAIMADATEQRAFSNHTEWEIWANNWCWYPCKQDRNEDCPLIMVSLLGYRPKEWKDADDKQAAGGRYECTEFEPDDEDDDDGEPEPEPRPVQVVELPDQIDMFEVFAEQIAEAPQREAVSA